MKNALFLSLCLALISLVSPRAGALEFGCRLSPSELNSEASRLIRIYNKKNQSFPDTGTFPVKFKFSVNNQGQTIGATLEGFFRPLDDDYYALLPIPLLGAELSRDRHLLYICAHADEDPAKTHVTVYLMRGYHMDPTRLGTFIGDLTHKPRARVQPITVSILNTTHFNRLFDKVFGRVPLLNQILKIPEIPINALQSVFQRVLGDFAGLGVERIVMTTEYVELASRVDLDHPAKAVLLKKIDLKELAEKNAAALQ